MSANHVPNQMALYFLEIFVTFAMAMLVNNMAATSLLFEVLSLKEKKLQNKKKLRLFATFVMTVR